MKQNIDKVYHVYDQIGCKQSLTVNLCTNWRIFPKTKKNMPNGLIPNSPLPKI